MAKDRPIHDEYFAFYDLPIMYTPLTKMTDHWGTAQKGHCAAREIDWVRCAARVGELRGRTECRKFLEDFMECAHKVKATKRYGAMYAERKKQGRPYLDPPPKDSVYINQG